MAELVKKLNIKKNGTTTSCKIYSTVTEAGSSYVSTKVDNVAAYIPLVATSDGRASAGRVTKSGNTQAIASTGKPPYNKIEHREPGTYTFTVPAGVTTIKATVAGAGGGGGGGLENRARYGGTGGRGGYISVAKEVVSGKSYAITVGAGGAGGRGGATVDDAQNGKNGGDSNFEAIVATGGGGGEKVNPDNGANGSNGTPIGNGGAGGGGGTYTSLKGKTGQNGWVIIEYGGDI